MGDPMLKHLKALEDLKNAIAEDVGDVRCYLSETDRLDAAETVVDEALSDAWDAVAALGALCSLVEAN